MEMKQLVLDFWEDVLKQNPIKLQTYFESKAIINWHNTNESFTPEEYIKANCEYPGTWLGEVERFERLDDLVITVTRVWSVEDNISVHATSFIKFCGEKIIRLDEYWGDDGDAPQWRQDKKIGKPIK
ncbi:MAG: nuclear transport factor 2 family protein [Turicibacter sp.]